MKAVQERLKEYGKQYPITADETKLKDTIWRSRDVFYQEAEKFPASYFEFFCQQTGYIRKRWWGMQFLVLTALWCCIRIFSGKTNLQSVMGAMAAVFAILLIPELWKSKAVKAMEVEGSTFYSLRQIYAVRMLAFGVMDVGLLTLFTVAASMATPIMVREIIIYFFLPFTVACGILFSTLCSKHIASQTGAYFFSLLWMAVWLLIVINGQIYEKISTPVWAVLFAMAVFYLGYGVKKTLTTCENYWEVVCDGIAD